MKQSAKSGLLALCVALFATSVVLQNSIDPKRDKIQKPIIGKQQADLIFKLPAPYIIASFTGMRESVAGLLWVRADSFFHAGNYEAILPLVRIITWLDPHYVAVYKTGAWHLDFNITDAQERSDRRYIPPALALLHEGFKHNSDSYDIPLDLAWTHHFMKRKSYEDAVKWMEIAATKRDMSGEPSARREPYPVLVKRLLAHMYEKVGDIESSKKAWLSAIQASEELLRKYPTDGTFATSLEVSRRNYELMLWREKQRKYDIYPPVDVKFEANWSRPKPKTLVISGKMNLISKEDYLKMNPDAPPDIRSEAMRVRLEALRDGNYVDGGRIEIVLKDIDYEEPVLDEFTWEVPKDATIMIESVRVSDGKFEIEIDMSRDPQMYSFKKDKYRLILTFDPRGAPDFIQDRIGWLGEGMTDKNYLDTTSVPGVRMIRKEWIIDRKDLI